MADIYQKIWSADQQENGLEAILSDQQGDEQTGYVKVNSNLGDSGDPELRVLPEVKIPAHKVRSYDLCRKLFNNYALPEADLEIDTATERAERHEFIEAITQTAPMNVAKQYIEEQTQTVVSSERWHNTLVDHWFRRFEQSGDPHLSGFEHVVVGEQERSKVQGYHFWYKYYLDDGFAQHVDDGLISIPALSDDRITYVRSHASAQQLTFPESVTIQFKWNAPDYDRQEVRPLHKPLGGFFVGCSVEGLMALGTVRAHLGALAPKSAVIEGARYELKMFRSANNRHIRTFYPVFKGAADPVVEPGNPVPPIPTPPDPVIGERNDDVRIIAAFVNPRGHDPGRENVTIVQAGPDPVNIVNWRIRDKNGSSEILGDIDLAPGTPHTIVLDGSGAQLSNKGSTIALLNQDRVIVHEVSYSKSQAREQNRTVLFC